MTLPPRVQRGRRAAPTRARLLLAGRGLAVAMFLAPLPPAAATCLFLIADAIPASAALAAVATSAADRDDDKDKGKGNDKKNDKDDDKDKGKGKNDDDGKDKKDKDDDDDDQPAPPAPAQPPAAGGAWALDETSGETANDGSGSGLTGAYVNGVTQGVSGPKANTKAAQFDGTNDYVEINTNLASLLGGTASVSYWVQTTTKGNNTPWSARGILGVEHNGGTNDIFWGYIDGSGKIAVAAGNGASAKSTTTITDGQWHHVVLTRDHLTGVVKVYVDGALQGSATSDKGVKSTAFARIGSIPKTGGAHNYFKGSLADLRIFPNQILDPAQVEAVMNSPAPSHSGSSQPRLVRWKQTEVGSE